MSGEYTPAVDNALSPNTIGLPSDLDKPRGARAFPAWIELKTLAGITTLRIGALRIEDIAELIFIEPYAFVWDVGHVSGHRGADGKWKPMSLADIPKGIDVHVLASEGDIISIGRSELLELVSTFGHYQLSALGMPNPPLDLVNLWVHATEAAEAGGVPLLSAVTEADAFLDIHDNCYVYIEVRDPARAIETIGRLLWIAVATAARSTGHAIPTSPPPRSVIDSCLGDSGLFFAPMNSNEANGTQTIVPFAHSAFALTEAPEPTKLL